MKTLISFLVLLLMASPLCAAEKNIPAPAPAVPLAAPALVAPAAAPAVPDTSNILFMQNLRKIGATIYYLGESLGLHGWFVVKDGQVQILYTTQDQKALIVGALLSSDGANVSQQQVMVLANSNPEIQKVLKTSAALTAPTPQADAAKPLEAAPEIVATSPSEKLYAALLKAENLTFGKEGVPQLLMIMDVNCTHCHAAWKKLAPLVEAGRLRVTMIPIMGMGPQSQIEGANWLSKKDPYDAWKKHVAGDEKVFKTGTQEPEKEKAVFENTNLIHKWGIDQTPYILYYGKNGKVRLVLGEPNSAEDVMNDIR